MVNIPVSDLEELEKKLLNFAHHYEYEQSWLAIKDLKKMTDKEFNEYCSKIIKQLCKSIADDLDFYDFKRHSAGKKF